MFQFPGSAFSYPMNSDMDTTPLRVVGFPIRKSPDQSLLTALPKHIGVRPRPSSPPSAKGIHRAPLSNLTVKKNHYVISCLTN